MDSNNIRFLFSKAALLIDTWKYYKELIWNTQFQVFRSDILCTFSGS